MDILEALQRTRDRVAHSTDSDWSTRSTKQMLAKLDKLIRSIESGGRPRIRLGMLFVATGDLQEISMANGWADEFLELAEVVDGYLREGIYGS